MIDIEDNDYDEFPINDNVHSECCGASIWGEVVDDLGICSRCKEWSGVIQEAPEEE